MNSDELELMFFSPGGLHDEAVEPIATEAESRGHDVDFCRDVTADAEIGIYNQHTHKIPAINADLSLISFHGIDQGYLDWQSETWSRFDVGLLPSEVAAENWRGASWKPNTRPSIGAFTVGWPKSDVVATEAFDENVAQIVSKYGINDGTTTIYAPTVENDDKIHEYVDAAKGVAETILVKHAPYESTDYLEDLYEPYRDDDQVCIFDPSEPIFPCLGVADVLVSDESSVLQEAALTQTIPVSVTDWPMRNRTRTYPGKQLPEFAHRTSRDHLSSTLEELFDDYASHRESLVEYRDRHYANFGQSASVVVDLIEAIVDDDPLPLEPIAPVNRRFGSVHRAYFKTRAAAAKPYHRARAGFVNRFSDDHIETFERLRLHKALHLVDRLIGKQKYR